MSEPEGMVRAYINLPIEDKETLAKEYGHGWSSRMRDLIHEHCIYLRQRRMKETFGHVDD